MFGDLRSACDRQAWKEIMQLAKKSTPDMFVYIQGLKKPQILGFFMYHASLSVDVDELFEPMRKHIPDEGILLIADYNEEYYDGAYPHTGIKIFKEGWQDSALDEVKDSFRRINKLDASEPVSFEHVRPLIDLNSPRGIDEYIGVCAQMLALDGNAGTTIPVDEDTFIYASFIMSTNIDHGECYCMTKDGPVFKLNVWQVT